MDNPIVGSFQLMKSMNKSLLLNLIRTEGPISRAELAKKTNLTPPTVTNLVGELLESKLVIESDLGESTGGRKPIMLRINASAFQVIGIDVGVEKIRVLTTNLLGEIGLSRIVPIPKPITNELFLSVLADSIKILMNDANLQQESILGIGIGMHGLVNPLEGKSVFAPNLGLRNIPIKEYLEQQFNLPVEVENDVRAFALGESWFGHGQGVKQFICINVGAGVGAGIIFDHQLFRGKNFSAGEIGHTTIDVNGPACSCGNKGCLQAFVSGPAIAESAQEAIRNGRESNIMELVGEHLDQITGEIVYQAAQQGDVLALEILECAGRFLGIGIANLINTLNPEQVIIGGGVMNAKEFILPSLKEAVYNRVLEEDAKSTPILSAHLGENATGVGAATLILRKIFS